MCGRGSATFELAPHQLEAVARIEAILARHPGVLLADDVGLGKSYVAAEVARRSRASVELIVPAALVAQWTAFDLDARITTHDRIVNEPFDPRAEGNRLLVVDEAHAFRNLATQRYAALARRSIGARMLLITATPVCNSPDDLHALVRLIAADDALRGCGVASIDDAFRAREIAAILRELVIRRGVEVLVESLRFGSIERVVIRHDVPHVAIDALQFPLIGGHAPLLRGVLWRRLESSAAALLDSIKRQTRFYERALDALTKGRTLTKREYKFAFGDDEAFQEVLFWDVFAGDETRADADAIRAELSRLDNIRDVPETKLLPPLDEPALIFTSAIATARAVHATLRNAGLITSRGAVPINALDAFRTGKLDALVCTDLAAEGLNLQRAGVVVHYDLPWNPVKLDQRNGRALRIGQQRGVVRAIYFVPRGGHTRVLRAIARKNRQRNALLNDPREAAEAESIDVLPQHLPRDAPAVALLNTLRRRGLSTPPHLTRRYRAGIEQLFAEMAGEYLDERRVSDLTSLLERERIIAAGALIGPSDR